MTDLHQVYRHVVTEGPGGNDDLPCAVVEEVPALSAPERVVAAAEQLQAVFDQFAQVPAVAVFVDGVAVGTTLREDYPSDPAGPEVPGVPGDSRVGEGDGAVLPGQSRHYEAFRHTCPQCGEDVYTTAAQAPLCPRCQVGTIPAS